MVAISRPRSALRQSMRPRTLNWGWLLRQQGKSEEAEEEFRKATELDPHLTAAARLQRNSKTEATEFFWDEALSIEWGSVSFRMRLLRGPYAARTSSVPTGTPAGDFYLGLPLRTA